MPASTACLIPAVGTGLPSPAMPNNGGQRHWSMTRDTSGYRDYKLKYRIQCDVLDGPYRVLYYTPGLPSPGSAWLIDNDYDQWAFCTQEATVTPVAPEGQPNEFFDVELTFSSRPQVLCQDDTGGFEDPLLRADIISGSFAKYTKEAIEDANGDPIFTSSWEQFRGPQVEKDNNRPQVRVQQNVSDLDMDTLCLLIDTVNDAELWGFAIGTVKFSGCSWEKHYATDCTVYYTRVLEFDIDVNTWVRQLLDEGTKALPGHYDRATGAYVIDLAAAVQYSTTRTSASNSLIVVSPGGSKIVVGQLVQGTGIPTGTTVTAISLPTVTISANATSSGTDLVKFGVTANASNPHHFVRYQDLQGNTARVILNGAGKPWDPFSATSGTDDDSAGRIPFDPYPSGNFGLLSLPGSL